MPFSTETMTAATDPDGNAALAWGDWGVAALVPDGDVQACSVGLY